MEGRRFLYKMWGKFSLGASLLAVTTLSAAASVIVNQVDGVNFRYSATDVNGTLTVTFDPSSLVTKINGSALSTTLPATFAQLTLNPTFLTDDISGQSGHFTPNLNSTQYGISSLTPPAAPNVVFDYGINFGQASGNGLTLNGSIGLDPASGTTFTEGTVTYDFSAFQNPGTFTLTLGTSDSTGLLLYNTLKSGNGTFTGTGQFDQIAAPVPEPGTAAFFCGFCLASLPFLRRKKA